MEQKQLIKKSIDRNDTRSYTIQLTSVGKNVVVSTEGFANPITSIVGKTNDIDKSNLWKVISNLIIELNKTEIISVQRTCFNCKHYSTKSETHFCNLLNQKLKTEDIRIDCGEFAKA